MRKVKITLRGGGALEWTPKEKTKNIIGLWTWMNRTQNGNATLSCVEGAVRISEIAAMEYIEESEVNELVYLDGKQVAKDELEVDKSADSDDTQYRTVTGIVYVDGSDPFAFRDLNSYPRVDVYPSLYSFIRELGYATKEEKLISKGYLFAEVTCRVPTEDFERFKDGNWVLVNRENILSNEVQFEESYELKLGHATDWYPETKRNKRSSIAVFDKKTAEARNIVGHSPVCALVPVMSSSLEETGRVHVPCYYVAKAYIGEA